MEGLTLLGFEYDSAACKNSFNSSFHLLQASDKSSWSNLSDLDVDNLFIIGKLKSDKVERNETSIFYKLDEKQSFELNEVRGTRLMSFLILWFK